MADSSDIDNALIAKLAGDAALLALCPNGVYYDEAPPKSTRFVIVTVLDAVDEPMYGGRAFEDVKYLVRAVMRSNANGNIQAAAARIDALLDQQPLTVSGYAVSVVRRVSRSRETVDDEENPTFRWFFRGGTYQVVASTP